MGRKVKGQAAKAAHALFAVAKHRKMEEASQRTTMALALRMSTDDRMRALARDAVDPIHRLTAFTTLAEKLGLTYEDVAKEFTTIRKSEGLIRMAEHLPDVMEQTIIDAKSRDVTCERCSGVGKILDTAATAAAKREANERGEEVTEEFTKECPKCKGKGTIYELGNAERLKIVFDTFGLTGGKGGPMVNIDLRGKPGKGETLADLAGSLDGIVSGTARIRAEDSEPVQ